MEREIESWERERRETVRGASWGGRERDVAVRERNKENTRQK